MAYDPKDIDLAWMAGVLEMTNEGGGDCLSLNGTHLQGQPFNSNFVAHESRETRRPGVSRPS